MIKIKILLLILLKNLLENLFCDGQTKSIENNSIFNFRVQTNQPKNDFVLQEVCISICLFIGFHIFVVEQHTLLFVLLTLKVIGLLMKFVNFVLRGPV